MYSKGLSVQVNHLSARSENTELIKKNAGKKIILIDRFSDSTIAYQHYGMGVNLKFIQNINNYLLRGINVDFTFLNLVDQKNMKIRLMKRKKLNRYLIIIFITKFKKVSLIFLKKILKNI